MKLSSIRVDPSRLETAEWVGDFPFPDFEGVRFKVLPSGNREWRVLEARLVRQLPRKDRQKYFAGELPEQNDRIEGILLRDASLVDWEGIEDDAGPIAFSKEKANEFLTKPEWVTMRMAVKYASNIVADQDREDAQEKAKN